MKARVIIPPKFLAVFSNLEKMRRLSLSQPMRRSMMLRWRYASLSNSTGRAERSSFSFEGMTGVISRSSKYSSIQSARYPLSPPRANGQAIRSPYSSTRCSSAVMSKSSTTVDSCACPAVKWNPRGRPFPSQRMWIFVEKPPRERPNAWSSGSCGSLFFHRQLHTARLGQSYRRYTKALRRLRPLRQTPIAGVAESRPASRWHSIDRTFSNTSSTHRILREHHATETRFATPTGFRRAPSGDPSAGVPSQMVFRKHSRSIPIRHQSTTTEPSKYPPWQNNLPEVRSFTKSMKQHFWDRA